jgi:hypothetical protein
MLDADTRWSRESRSIGSLFSRTPTNKNATREGPRIYLSGPETHRLMRYCTVQFSRNGRFRQARFGLDH